MINKAVVGSGHGDAPKYVGKGVALHGTPGALGVPVAMVLLFYGCFQAIFGEHDSDTPCLKRIILFSDVMSLKGAVMSYVTHM